eukprot:TRINITY_DN37013_c0_g1_i1.p1 TRINITY_DN37013_c0_g1~~TRINITY_DN37013_c0_g1_i1.p1  ORF type:complete len:257 (+),score=46.96 TRINITY_DN37013_c0_g1_i1:38-772(+)
MSVTLHVVFPTTTVSVEVHPKDKVRAMKITAAEAAGLNVDGFKLLFEGEPIDDEKEVSQYPLRDQSELRGEVSEAMVRKLALNRLKELGHGETNLRKMQELFHQEISMSPADDEKNCAVLAAMNVVGMFIDEIDNLSEILLGASYTGAICCARYLLDNNLADPNYQSNGNMYQVDCTPLHLAAYRQNVGMVQLLLSHNADPTREDDSCISALEEARQLGKVELYNVLKEGARQQGSLRGDGSDC